MSRSALRRSTDGTIDTTTFWERVVYWGLVGLLFWAPLPFGSNRPWAVAVMVIWVAALGLLWSIGWAAGKCHVHSSFQRGRLALGLLVAWAVLISLQTLELPIAWLDWLSPGAASVFGEGYGGAAAPAATLSIHPAATGRYQLLTLALVGYFALMLLVIQRTERLKHFALMLVLSGSMCAILALYLHFTGTHYVLFHEFVTHEVAKAPFINRNHLAAYLEICLAVGVGLIVAEFEPTRLDTWKQRMRWLLRTLMSAKMRTRLLLIVMVIALILTRSRMGNTAFFASLIAGGFIALLCLKVGWKTILVFLGGMIILDMVIIGSWIGVEQVVKRVQQTAISVDVKRVEGWHEQSLEERTDQGFSALASLGTFRFFGTGAGTFEAMYSEYKQPGFMLSLDHAHNDYVEFLVEGGWSGITLLVLLVVYGLAKNIGTVAHTDRAAHRGLALGCLIALISVAIHSTVEFALQMPAVALGFCAVIGVACLAAQTRQTGDGPHPGG